MKSLKRVFNKIKKQNPYWSDYICFAKTVWKRKFSRQTIARNFNKLVDKNEIENRDKKSLLRELLNLSQEA